MFLERKDLFFLFSLFNTLYLVSAFYPTFHEISSNLQLSDQFSSTPPTPARVSISHENDDQSSDESRVDFDTSTTVRPRDPNHKKKPTKQSHSHDFQHSNHSYRPRQETNRDASKPKYQRENQGTGSSRETPSGPTVTFKVQAKIPKEKPSTTTKRPKEKEKQKVKASTHQVQHEDNNNSNSNSGEEDGENKEVHLIPMHLMQHHDQPALLARKPQYEPIPIQAHPDPVGQYHPLMNMEHKEAPRIYDYDNTYANYDVAYRSDFYWLIPLVIIIGIGALILPLCSLFMTTMVSNGAISLSGRRKRSTEEVGNSISDQVFELISEVEDALIRVGKQYNL